MSEWGSSPSTSEDQDSELPIPPPSSIAGRSLAVPAHPGGVPRAGSTPHAHPDGVRRGTPRAGGARRPGGTPRACGGPCPGSTPRAGGGPHPGSIPRAAGGPRPGSTPRAGGAPRPGSTPRAGGAPHPGDTPHPDGAPRPGGAESKKRSREEVRLLLYYYKAAYKKVHGSWLLHPGAQSTKKKFYQPMMNLIMIMMKTMNL